MTTIISQCGPNSTETVEFIPNGAPCFLADHNGDPCEACVELAQIEAQVEELHSKLKGLRRRHSILTWKRHKCWIDKLPNEIMADIILRVCLPAIYPVCSWDRDTSARGPHLLHALTLSKVCHRWRDLVFSITKLWSAIPIEVSEPNVPLINHHLRLSGPMSPLSVTLFTIHGKAFDDDAVFNAMAFVNENIHRIAYLCLSGTDDFFRALASSPWICPDAAPILEELHIHQLEHLPFDRLEEIQIHRNGLGFQSSSVDFNLCKNVPRPQRVYIHGYCPPRIHLDWSHVSNLRLRCWKLPPLEVVDILSKAKSLVEFECDTTILDVTFTMPHSTITPIVQDSIRTARISSADSQREVFSNTTMGSLESLKIEHFDSPQLHVLAFLQRSSHQLTSLVLSFDYRPGEELIDIFRNTSVLQTLELHFGGSLTTGDARLLPFPKSLSLPVSQVVNPVQDPILLPHLEKLHLSGNLSVRYSPYLKIMENRCATIDLLGGGQVRALDELMIRTRLDHRRQIPVTQGELRRILDLRKAKKIVLISFSTTFSDKQVDFVEQAIASYQTQ